MATSLLAFALGCAFFSIGMSLGANPNEKAPASMTWPPSGFMSWGHFRCQVDCVVHPNDCINEQLYQQMADALVDGGFADAGYRSVHVDDCWQSQENSIAGLGRDPSTFKLTANATRFPSGMKALSDYLHSRRLFFGFYSTLYYTSCAFVYPGSRSSELLDVMTFANDWDIDYLKLDGCNPDYSPTGLGYYQYGYADAGRALSLFKNATGKSITYSCSWPAYLPPDETTKGIYPAMIADGCNLWRNYDDIQPYWSSLSNIIEHWGTYGQFLKQFSGPTTISDADMLIVGEPGITDDEGRTQMAIWSIIMSPLLISADVRNISDTAKAILLNQEALAVNRDTRYEMGYRVMNDLQTGGQAWARNMSDGSVAFALYNSGSAAPLNVSVPFKSLNASWAPGSGLSYRVRDIWAQQDIGIFNSLNFTGSLIPPHGTGFYRAWASS